MKISKLTRGLIAATGGLILFTPLATAQESFFVNPDIPLIHDAYAPGSPLPSVWGDFPSVSFLVPDARAYNSSRDFLGAVAHAVHPDSLLLEISIASLAHTLSLGQLEELQAQFNALKDGEDMFVVQDFLQGITIALNVTLNDSEQRKVHFYSAGHGATAMNIIACGAYRDDGSHQFPIPPIFYTTLVDSDVRFGSLSHHGAEPFSFGLTDSTKHALFAGYPGDIANAKCLQWTNRVASYCLEEDKLCSDPTASWVNRWPLYLQAWKQGNMDEHVAYFFAELEGMEKTPFLLDQYGEPIAISESEGNGVNTSEFEEGAEGDRLMGPEDTEDAARAINSIGTDGMGKELVKSNHN